MVKFLHMCIFVAADIAVKILTNIGTKLNFQDFFTSKCRIDNSNFMHMMKEQIS